MWYRPCEINVVSHGRDLRLLPVTLAMDAEFITSKCRVLELGGI